MTAPTNKNAPAPAATGPAHDTRKDASRMLHQRTDRDEHAALAARTKRARLARGQRDAGPAKKRRRRAARAARRHNRSAR